MKVTIKNNEDIRSFSESYAVSFFGDEATEIAFLLSECFADAVRFGLVVERRIPDLFGGHVDVVSIPPVRRHEWSF